MTDPRTIWLKFAECGEHTSIRMWSFKNDFEGATRFDAQGELPADVRQLVIAAREAWQAGDAVDEETLQQLDKALEAFADRVPWDMG